MSFVLNSSDGLQSTRINSSENLGSLWFEQTEKCNREAGRLIELHGQKLNINRMSKPEKEPKYYWYD